VFDALDGDFAPDKHIYPAGIRLLTLQHTTIRPRRRVSGYLPDTYGNVSADFRYFSEV